MRRYLLALVVGVAAIGGAALVRGQEPTFRADVRLAVVDVQVVDQDGQPVEGLDSTAFDVRLNGRRRTVQTVDLVRVRPWPSAPEPVRPPGPGPVARNIWPSHQPEPNRTVVLAIDAASFDAGDAALVVDAASRFVDRLAPADPVGVVTLPGGPSLHPTTDRVALHQVLARVSGVRAMRANPFHLTPAEASDIVAEMDRMTATRLGSGRGASLFTPITLRQVQARECNGPTDQSCVQGIVIDADAQLRQIEDDAAESLGGLRSLLSVLAGLPGRKTVVLLSGGMPVSDRAGGWHSDGSEIRGLGRAAAVANATVYAIHVDRTAARGQNAEARVMRPSVTIARDRELQQRLLAAFATTAGGALFEAPIDAGAAALARVLAETSAHYTLGIVADVSDLDGRVHELRVSARGRGLVVRSPRYVLLRSR